MRNRVHAIIVAAGSGRRAGLSGGTLKKQFAEVGGCPVIIHTLTAFCNSPSVDTVVCVIAQEDRDYCNDLMRRYPVPKINGMVEGGACRQESVAAGLSFLERTCSLDDVVLVHDGVRPLVSPPLIERVIHAAIQHGGAVAALPATDSLKQVSSEGFIQQSLPRETVWTMQTPQAFRLGLLLEGMKKAMADHFIGTDEASLVERLDHPVFCVEGFPENIKITTSADMAYVEALLGVRCSGYGHP